MALAVTVAKVQSELLDIEILSRSRLRNDINIEPIVVAMLIDLEAVTLTAQPWNSLVEWDEVVSRCVYEKLKKN